MNRETIVAMVPGDELDLLVAREVLDLIHDGNDEAKINDLIAVGHHRYSRNISEAWEAVEKKAELPFSLNKTLHGWTVNWCISEYTCEGCEHCDQCEGDCEVQGKTAPEAIAKALLLQRLEP